MPNLIQENIILEVRRKLDETVFSGDLVADDQELESSAASNFSDEDLGHRINDAAKYVAARVKAQYLPDLIENVNLTRVLDYEMLRFLGSRVKVNSLLNGEIQSTRKSFKGLRRTLARGTPDTELDPVYVFEDYELFISPDPLESTTTTSIDILRVPGSPFGQFLDQTREAVEELDDRFKDLVINKTLVYCYATMERYDLASKIQEKVVKEIEPFQIKKVLK